MKITEELWNKYSNDFDKRNEINTNYILNTTNYYSHVLRKITKKEILSVGTLFRSTTIEGYQQLNNFILGEEFLNKFNLTPGFNSVVGISAQNFHTSLGEIYTSVSAQLDIYLADLKEDTVKSYPLILFGDNLIIPLDIMYNSNISNETDKICEGDNKQIIIEPTEIYYTSDKYDEVIEILKTLSDFAKSLPTPPNNYDKCIRVEFAYLDSSGSIKTIRKFVKINDIELDQFNESLPHEKIINIINKDEPGLIILHGEPGCGKSSYIRYLIKECNKQFIIMSQDLLQNMNSFREFLLGLNKEAIIVVEDCENLVKSREKVGSGLVISDFLNITDGIYGDLYRLKFILTFNTDVQTIDQALLRRGRLKCKYKFNKLKGDKLKKLSEKLGITLSETQIKDGLSLADLFNYDEDNGGKQKEVVKIGFNK